VHTDTRIPYVAERQAAVDAARLIDDYGDAAFSEAAALANISRDRGNVVNFCRWRQIARLIAVMTDSEAEQTRH